MNTNYNFVITQDGTPTLYDESTGEHHHSLVGAYTEALYKFVNISQPVINACQNHNLKVLDLPFGLGYNLIALIKFFEENNINKYISCTAIELDFKVLEKIKDYPQEHELKKYFQLIENIDTINNHQLNSQKKNFSLNLHNDDLLTILPELSNQEAEEYNLIYYDPFSPRVAPTLWSKEYVLSHLSTLLNKDNGLFITYSASNKVRKALYELGLYIAPSRAVGRKMPGTIASFNQELLQRQEFTEETWTKIHKTTVY